MGNLSFGIKAFKPSVSAKTDLFKSLQERALRNVSNQMKRDFEATISSWTIKVDFKVSRKSMGDSITFIVSTDNEIYIFVSGGTIPHPIAAKNVPFLKFQVDYTAKTQPGLLRSGPGGKSGAWATRLEVDHPGTEARNFHIIIAERAQEKYTEESNRALQDYLKQSVRPALPRKV